MKYVCVKLFIIYIGENSINNSILRQTQNFSNQSLCDLRLSIYLSILSYEYAFVYHHIAHQYPVYAWVTRISEFFHEFLYRTLLCVNMSKINSSTRAHVDMLCIELVFFVCFC